MTATTHHSSILDQVCVTITMAPPSVPPSPNPNAPAVCGRGRGRGRPRQNGRARPQPHPPHVPYTCVVCGRLFQRRHALSGHMNAHRQRRTDVNEREESSVCTAESTTTTLVPLKMVSGPGGTSVGGLPGEVFGPSNGPTVMAEGKVMEEEVEQVAPGLGGQVSLAGVCMFACEHLATPPPADDPKGNGA